MNPPSLLPADYSSDPVLADEEAQAIFCLRIAMASQLVAQQYGPDRHQDIEGVVTSDCRLFIVQTRPQA